MAQLAIQNVCSVVAPTSMASVAFLARLFPELDAEGGALAKFTSDGERHRAMSCMMCASGSSSLLHLFYGNR